MTDTHPSVQVSCSDSFSARKFLLLEIPDDHVLRTLKRGERYAWLNIPDGHLVSNIQICLLKHALNQLHTSIVIKGNQDDEAIACTSKQSYSVRQADVSNSILIVDRNATRASGSDTDNMHATNATSTRTWTAVESLSGYFELQLVPPRIDRLRKILAERPYWGPDNESDDATYGMHTLDDLIAQTQASRIETLQAIKDMNAFTINGVCKHAAQQQAVGRLEY
jgi:hypothetical protein